MASSSTVLPSPPSSLIQIDASPVTTSDSSLSYLHGVAVHLDRVHRLPKMDQFGTCDPFVILSIGGQERRSSIIKNTQDPEYHENFSFVFQSSSTGSASQLSSLPTMLHMSVWDWDKMSKNEYIGQATIRIEAECTKTYKIPLDKSPNSFVELSVTMRSLPHVSGFIRDGISAPNSFSPPSSFDSPPSTARFIDTYTSLADVHIIEARHLKNKDLVGKSDPYVVLQYGHAVYRTNVVSNSANPRWDELCPLWMAENNNNNNNNNNNKPSSSSSSSFSSSSTLSSDAGSHLLRFTVYDADMGSASQLIGVAFLPLNEIPKGKTIKLKLPLSAHAPETDAELLEFLRNFHFQTQWILEEKTGNNNNTSNGNNNNNSSRNNSSDNDSKYIPATGKNINGELFVDICIKERSQVEDEFWHTLMELYDQDHNGVLDVSEFIHLCSSLNLGYTNQQIVQIYNRFDEDKSKTLTKEEIIKLFKDRQFISAERLSLLLKDMKYGKDALSKIFMKDYLHNPSQSDIGGGADVWIDPSDNNNNNNSNDTPTEDDFSSEINNSGVRILVQERASRQIIKENIPLYIKAALRVLYRTRGGREVTKKIASTLIALSKKQGQKMDSIKSAKDIPAFVSTHKINTAEIELSLDEYKNFNEFFYRKLKPNARIIAAPEDNSIAISPADCRLMVFPSLEEAKQLWIKGKNFSLENLLGKFDAETRGMYTRKFLGASLVIARLAPQDYHRFHWGVSGRPGKRFCIDGELNTVNPIAIRKEVDVYTENKRVICPIESEKFGTVLAIAIGATMVGSIRFECRCKSNAIFGANYHCSDGSCFIGQSVEKFAPHGYFAFGGSTVLYLFQSGSILFDDDLLNNSRKQLETLVKVGASMGKATGKFIA